MEVRQSVDPQLHLGVAARTAQATAVQHGGREGDVMGCDFCVAIATTAK
jgi:hypothetical protein